MSDFYAVKAGEWVTPVHQGYLMECCDCGLVHRLDFRVIKAHKLGDLAQIQNAKYRVQFRAYREGYKGMGGYHKKKDSS